LSVAVTAPQALRLGEDRRGAGWVTFAAAMLILLGCTNTIEGVAAASGSHFFASGAHFVVGDLQTWGWFIWIVGVAQGLTGVAVLFKYQFARWLGVAFALINGLTQLLVIQAYPFWSLALFSLDILVIYGLVVYGGRTYRPA
jgi:hypothetical protein